MPRETVASPCRNLCRLGHDQACVGCGRTIGEITEWPAADDERRRQICQSAARRLGPGGASAGAAPATQQTHSLDQFAHRIPMAVRWSDLDAMGHVNNVKFFTYAESGRIAYFDELARGDSAFWNDHGLILAHTSADFLAQLHYPADLDVGTRVERIGRSSLHVIVAIFCAGRLIAVVKAVVVWFDYVNQKPMPIPDHVRERIHSRELVKPIG